MPRKPKSPPDDPEQSKRFIEMAREVGADASKEAFERAFKEVVTLKKPASWDARTHQKTLTRPSAM
jgi:hypothetical protein